MDETVESFDEALINVADPCPAGSDAYVYLASHREAAKGQARFIGVNLKYMGYIAERAVRFSPPASYKLVTVAPHWETFPAIAYEGRKPWVRRRIAQRRPTMRIYERRDSEAHVAAAGRHTNLP